MNRKCCTPNYLQLIYMNGKCYTPNYLHLIEMNGKCYTPSYLQLIEINRKTCTPSYLYLIYMNGKCNTPSYLNPKATIAGSSKRCIYDLPRNNILNESICFRVRGTYVLDFFVTCWVGELS